MTGPRERKRAPADSDARREFSSPACLMQEFESAQTPPARRTGIHVKRIYDEPDPADGWRVLVDRLWPRGVKKEQAGFDVWAKDLAPSTTLRKWFSHDPQCWNEFRKRYRAELTEHAAEMDALRQRAERQRVTLLYAAREPRFNHAIVLQEILGRATGSTRK